MRVKCACDRLVCICSIVRRSHGFSTTENGLISATMKMLMSFVIAMASELDCGS